MGWKVSCAYLVYCVSRILFRMSLAMGVRRATYGVRHNTHDMLPQHQLKVTM